MKKIVFLIPFILLISLNNFKANADENNIPTIELNNEPYILLEKGVSYEEYGASAYDSEDGDLTESISIDSTQVNIDKVGDYEVVYTVFDQDQNKATVVRTVKVIDQFLFKQDLSMSKTIIKKVLPINRESYLAVGNCITKYNNHGEVIGIINSNDLNGEIFYEVQKIGVNQFIAISLNKIIRFDVNLNQLSEFQVDFNINEFSYISDSLYNTVKNPQIEVKDIKMDFNKKGYTVYGTIKGDRISDKVTKQMKTDDDVFLYSDKAGGFSKEIILKFDLQGNFLWRKIFPISTGYTRGGIKSSENGIYYILNTASITTYNEMVLVHLGYDGTIKWVKNIPDYISYVNDFIITQDQLITLYVDYNDQYLNLSYSLGLSFGILKYDSNGELVSDKSYYNHNGIGKLRNRNIIELYNGELVLTSSGKYGNHSYYTSRIFKIDANGDKLSEQTVENVYFSQSYLGSNENLLVVGIDNNRQDIFFNFSLNLSYQDMNIKKNKFEFDFNDEIDLNNLVQFEGVDKNKPTHIIGTVKNEVGHYDLIFEDFITISGNEYLVRTKSKITINPIIQGIDKIVDNEVVTPQFIGGDVSFVERFSYIYFDLDFYKDYQIGDPINYPGYYSFSIKGNNGYESYIHFMIEPKISGIKGSDTLDINEGMQLYRDSVRPVVNVGKLFLNGKPFKSGTKITENGIYTLRVAGIHYNKDIHFVIDKPNYKILYVGIGTFLFVSFSGIFVIRDLKRKEII